ncbi:unnamed protein product [Pleuronectes platessa]|uniref:Uncharacterized protein n=1 Tax=Pleuronectes platessa TaxID=8262 RepID=A0A9N7U7I1_PLEPL|nr:unnamed protein product [Pleuronectes platessa]
MEEVHVAERWRLHAAAGSTGRLGPEDDQYLPLKAPWGLQSDLFAGLNLESPSLGPRLVLQLVPERERQRGKRGLVSKLVPQGKCGVQNFAGGHHLKSVWLEDEPLYLQSVSRPSVQSFLFLYLLKAMLVQSKQSGSETEPVRLVSAPDPIPQGFCPGSLCG